MDTYFKKILEFLIDNGHYSVGPDMQPIGAAALFSLFVRGMEWLFFVVLMFFILVVIYDSVSWVRKICNFLMNKCLGIFMILVWLMGFATYCVGAHVPVGNHLLDVVPMAMIHATEMFLSISDISAIRPDCAVSPTFMTFFNLSHFFAILLSLVFILRQFGYYAMAKLRLILVSWCCYFTDILHITKLLDKKILGKKIFNKIFGKFIYDDVYVFWGVNDASYLLAKDILEGENDDLKNKNYRVIFVRPFDEDEYKNSNVNIFRIFNITSLTNRELNRLSKLENALTTSTPHRLSLLDIDEIREKSWKEKKENKDKSTKLMTEADKTAPVDILGEELEMYPLIRMIRHSGKETHLHIFFLGKDQNSNISATVNLKEDKTLANVKATIYCRARRSPKTRWMDNYEYLYKDNDTAINIIDPSYLAVLMLKEDDYAHPIRYADLDPVTGRVKSTFNSLIIGFGETGIEALKFLYEFGAFIDENGERTNYQHDVIDNRIDDCRGFYDALIPHLEASKESGTVNLHSYKVDSKDYWNTIDSLLPKLNYIMICVQKDDDTLKILTNICKHALKFRKPEKALEDKNMLRIYVRTQNVDYHGLLTKVCEEINSIYDDQNLKVIPFGNFKDMFTYKYIVSNEILQLAKEFNFEVCKKNQKIKEKLLEEQFYEYKENIENLLQKKLDELSDDQFNETVDRLSDDEKSKLYDNYWDVKLGIKTGHKIKKPYNYSVGELERMAYIRAQNISNSLYKDTLLYIRDFCKYEDSIRRQEGADSIDENTDYKNVREKDTFNNDIVNKSLKYYENARWTSHMYANGWVEPSEDNKDICTDNEIDKRKSFRMKWTLKLSETKFIKEWLMKCGKTENEAENEAKRTEVELTDTQENILKVSLRTYKGYKGSISDRAVRTVNIHLRMAHRAYAFSNANRAHLCINLLCIN